MRKFLQFTLSLLAMLMVTLNANAWKFTLDSPAAGEVESIPSIKLSFSGDGWLAEYSAMDVTLTGPNGSIACTLGNLNPSYVETNYTFKEITEPGTYTLTVPANTFHQSKGYDPNTWEAIKGDGNDEFTVTWTIKDSDAGGGEQGGGEQGGGEQGGGTTAEPWTFASVSPVEGEVESLGNFKFVYPALFSNWQTKGAGIANGGLEGTLTLPDGTIMNIKTMEDFDQENGELHLETMTAPGTYTITFAAGAGQSNGGVANAEMTYTWTIKGSDAPIANPYTLTYDKESQLLKLVKDGVQSYDVAYAGGASLEGYNGYFSFNPIDPEWTLMGNTCIGAYITLADGTYTLHVPAGTYLFDGVENEAFDITFTVGNGGGSDIGGGDFEGDPFHETIFKAGETVPAIPFVVDNNNVSISTVGRTFMDTTIDVGYNLYDTKELNWKNGTKFVITAKTDINKVIFVPTADSEKAIAYADADKGSYTNGVWEGKLAAGETLTLTANDGINIKEFYICYNGDDFDPISSGSNVEGKITILYPTENQLIAKQTDGGKFCTFTTNKEYAQVTIEVFNSNSRYDEAEIFPTQYFDYPVVGENTKYVYTPASGASGHGDDILFYKEDSYTVVVKGYLNMWDGPDQYDAIAEVHFIGNGKEHEPESKIQLLNVTPATTFEDPAKLDMVGGVVTLEFDGPVTSMEAYTPGGQFDPPTFYKPTPKAGTNNTVWEINLGDQSGLASTDTDGNPILEIDITAKAEDGVVIFTWARIDRGHVIKYELIPNAGPVNTVTLGTPVWSISEGAETEASTESINIKFPNATNVEGNYTLEVSGTIADRQMNYSVVSGTGTIANGADIAVNLEEDKAYNLVIGTITIKDANGGTVYSTEKGNYQLNFETKDSSIGGGGDNILGEPTITADADGITVSWPNADLEGTDADYVAFQEWTLTVNGTDYTYQPENIDGISDGISVTIPYEKIAVYDPTVGEWGEMVPVELASGDKITITIPEGAIEVDAGWTTVYANESAITVETTVPSNEPAPTSVVLYDFVAGDRTTLNDKTRSITKDGVTLTATGSNAYTVPAEGGNFAGLRVGKYVTLTVSAEQEIEKIEFATTGTVWSDDVTDLNGGSFNNATWTGSANSVTFKTPNDQTISKIVVYFKQENPQPESILGEPTVSIENNTLKIEFDAPENVEGASLATAGVKISVDGVDYYGNADEAFAENGKIVVEVPLSSTMEMVNFDSYSPQVGDELSITIIEPEVYANYADGNWEKVWEGDDITCSHTVSTTSGINNIAAGSANDKMYNVAGQQIKVAKGIVIKNGKKIFVK